MRIGGIYFGMLFSWLYAVSSCNAPVANSSSTTLAIVTPKLTFDVSTDSITVHWTTAADSSTSAGSLSYQVFYTTTNPDHLIPSAATIKSTWTSGSASEKGITKSLVSGLTAGTTYYFVVLVTNSAGNISLYTITAQTTESDSAGTGTGTDTGTGTGAVTATAPIPGDIGIISATNIGDTTLTLNWAAASDDITAAASLKYAVYISSTDFTTVGDWQNNALSTTLHTATANLTTLQVTGLRPLTSYYFMVIVANAAGQSAMYESEKVTTIADTVAPTPGNQGALTFNSATTTGFTVGWTTGTDDVTAASALLYEVFYSTTQANVASLAAITSAHLTGVEAAAGATSKAITGLTAGTTYYVNVMITDAANNSAIYTASSFATSPLTDSEPATISNSTLTITNVTTTSLTLSWSAATDTATAQSALTYQVYRSTASNVVDNLGDITTALNNSGNIIAVGSNTAGSTSINVTGLSSNTPYYFNVVVTNAGSYQAAYTQKNQTTTTGPIYMFSAGINHDGNLGGRSGADAFCSTKKISAYSSLSCTTIHALLSVNQIDYIANFPTQYGTNNGNFPHASPVIGAGPGGYTMATNWTTFLSQGPCYNGALCNGATTSFSSLVGGQPGLNFWTGSGSQGVLDNSGGTCSEWTSTSGAESNGDYRYYAFFSGSWHDNGCGLSYDLLCVCW